jgi:phosphate transport system substrate-binding protein
MWRLKLCCWLLVVPLVSGCGAAASAPADVTPVPEVRLTLAGSTTVQPLVEALAARYRQLHPNITMDIAAGGSVVGINAVHEGRVDIGMASRPLKADEAQGISAVPIASDVLAIIVHPANPVPSLSREQLRQIYLGQITNWREVGGDDRPIVPVVREVSSGTRGAFDNLVLHEAQPTANADVQVTAGEVEARVAGDPAAIGYVGFGNLASDVRVLPIDGALPSAASVHAGTYPLVRPLLLLLGPLSRPEARAFVEFAVSQEGQTIVERAGWIPNPSPIAVPTPSG